jgi:hypothetical protein
MAEGTRTAGGASEKAVEAAMAEERRQAVDEAAPRPPGSVWLASQCSECGEEDGEGSTRFHADGCSRDGRSGDLIVEVVPLSKIGVCEALKVRVVGGLALMLVGSAVSGLFGAGPGNGSAMMFVGGQFAGIGFMLMIRGSARG